MKDSFLEADIYDPENLDELDNELPFLSKIIKIELQRVEKPIANLHDQK